MAECKAEVVSINVSGGGIPKFPVEKVYVKVSGLEGDGHNHAKHYHFEQAVCLQDMEMLERLRKEGYPLNAGTMGENLTVTNLNVNSLILGAILEFQEGVVLKISKIRKPCYVLDSINPQLKEEVAGRCGMYAMVLREGFIKAGAKIYIIKST